MTKGFTREDFPSHPRLVFMGTPEFAVPTLRSLIDHGHDILAVVTQPDKPKGRGQRVVASPVKKLSMDHHIEVLQPQKASDELFCQGIRSKAPDLIVVVAFGQILKKRLLDIPQWGVINVHASLLPKLRGPAPIQWAILNDDSKTGLTIMKMDEGLDTGPILLQEEVPILKDETAGQLHDRLADKAGDFLVKGLHLMNTGGLVERPQESSAATYAPKIEKAACLVDWGGRARRVSALIRALDPKPGAYTTFQGREIKLFSSRVVDEFDLEMVPGRIATLSRQEVVVEAGEGRIGIREFQVPGKKRLAAGDFLRGFPLSEGAILGR
ncbi:MAG: methionyl-tRNA formyltransferase [Pseudomonadota bacterium]